MKPIITDRKAATDAGMLTDGRYFIRKDTGQAMYLPIWYGHRLDLANMMVTENKQEIFLMNQFPNINQLVKEGKVAEATIYREYEIYLEQFGSCGTRRELSEKQIRKMVKEFSENGFKVTREAILHNYNAWRWDMKSGYRDEENGLHLFTPCGCNPLSFRATSLEPELDWQTTYAC